MIKPLKSLNVRISSDLQKELMIISQRENIPISDLVRESLKQFIALRRFRKLRNQVLPYAESQGFLTEDDVFQLKS